MEEWRDVAFFEGRYQVSALGRVRSLPRVTLRPGKKPYPVAGKVLAQVTHHSGYKMITFIDADSRKHTFQVHRLVLEAFKGSCPPDMEACHGDNDPANNVIGNLRWDTRLGNNADKIVAGTTRRGELHHGAKLTRTQAQSIKPRIAAGETRAAIAAEFGVAPGVVERVARGERWAWL